ncbi:MAG: hypothetical protein AB7O59_25090 [Pirellulales bacterium]
MSVDTLVFLRDEQLPSFESWQQALAAAGIALEKIDDLRAHAGFIPAQFKGHESGFEWYLDESEGVFDEMPAAVAGRPYLASLVTHSDMRELVCAMYSAAALATLADGLVWDEEHDTFITGEQFWKVAQQVEAEYL